MAKEIDIKKLRQDLQTCIDELEKIENATEHYAANMWPRLQETAGRCAAAINAIRLHQQGKASGEIAAELGMSKQQVAAYVAWNTMYAPGWSEKNKQRKLDEARKKAAKAQQESTSARPTQEQIIKALRENKVPEHIIERAWAEAN